MTLLLLSKRIEEEAGRRQGDTLSAALSRLGSMAGDDELRRYSTLILDKTRLRKALHRVRDRDGLYGYKSACRQAIAQIDNEKEPLLIAIGKARAKEINRNPAYYAP